MFGLDGAASTAVDVAVVVLLTLLAGCVSGLTLSLFSIDETYLKTLADSAEKNPVKAHQAKRILQVVRTPHWLLVTLLVCNAGAVEAMPLLLDELLNPAAAVAISVVLVLIFGEVIPQAVFVRHALPIGSFFSYPLQFLMIVTAPISWVVGKLLDVLVGHRTAVLYRRHELAAFLMLQQELGSPLDDHGDAFDATVKHDSFRRSVELTHDVHSPLMNSAASPTRDHTHSVADRVRETFAGVEHLNQPTDNEISVMLGVLSLAEGTAASAIKTRPDDFVCVSADAVISQSLVVHVFMSGFSRILVHEGNNSGNIIGYIRAQDLVRFAIAPKSTVTGGGGGSGSSTSGNFLSVDANPNNNNNSNSRRKSATATAAKENEETIPLRQESEASFEKANDVHAKLRVAAALNVHTVLTIEGNVGLRQLYQQFLVPNSPQLALIVDSSNDTSSFGPQSAIGRTVFLKRTGPGSLDQVAAPSNLSMTGLLAEKLSSDMKSERTTSPPPSEASPNRHSSLRVLGLITMVDLMEYMHKASFPDETDRNLPDQIVRRIRQQEALHELKMHHAPRIPFVDPLSSTTTGRRATGAVMVPPSTPLTLRTPAPRSRATTDMYSQRPPQDTTRTRGPLSGYGAM